MEAAQEGAVEMPTSHPGQAVDQAHARAEAEWVPWSHLTPWAGNPRKNDGTPVDKVAASMIRFGWGNPILARHADREVVAGHTRLKAAKKLAKMWKAATPAQRETWRSSTNPEVRWHPEAVKVATEKMVLVRFGEWSEDDAHLLAMADNRLGELAEWDEALRDDLLSTLSAADMAIAGWDEAPKRRVIDEDDTPEPPANPITKLGDVWLLGDHVLVCGDCTADHGLERGADTSFTDPPYGVDYVSRVDEERRKNWGGIANDNLRGDELRAFLRATVRMLPFTYVCCDWHTYSDFEAALGKPKAVCVWDKGHFGLGKGYRRQHEFILFYGTLNRTDLSDMWAFSRDSSYQHPTQKPVALVAKALRDASAKVVFDPFLGSGTTLIAAEQVGAVCRGLELEPKYCDVIVERWQNLTGKKARRAA